MNKEKFDKIRYFDEMPWWLKTSILVPTALAAVTNLALGLALAQEDKKEQ